MDFFKKHRRKIAICLSSLAIILSGAAIFYVMYGYKLFIPETVTTNTGAVAAYVVSVEGAAEYKTAGTDTWLDAEADLTLREGDSIKTATDGLAVLELDNGDAIRVNKSSEIMLTSLDAQEIVIDVVEGECYSRVTKSDVNTYTVRGQGVSARAMGTAYLFGSNTVSQLVNVGVYESAVRVTLDEWTDEVNEAEKAVIDLNTGTKNVTMMLEADYTSTFVVWNNDQDNAYEKNGPDIVVSEPANGTSTTAATVAVKGTVTDESALKKIVVNGTIYMSKDGNGKGFNPADGTFDVDVALSEGENTISIVAYDIYWNPSATSSVTVTRTVEEGQNPPGEDYYFYISGISSPENGAIYVSWAISGYGAGYGFKVVAADHADPVYPGDSYQYLSSPDAREVYWTGVEPGTYYVRVCIYNGNGACLLYTDNQTVVVAGTPVLKYRVTLNWTSDGSEESYPTAIGLTASDPFAFVPRIFGMVPPPGSGTSPNGYKVCWATYENPTYPSASCQYVSNTTSSYTVSNLSAGTTYHFRVGAYLIEGGGCQIYSNDVSVTTP